MSKLFALLMLDVYLWHVFLLFSFFPFCNILRDFSFAKACMSTATSSSSTISTPVMVSMMSSIETTPRRQPYSSRMMEMC